MKSKILLMLSCIFFIVTPYESYSQSKKSEKDVLSVDGIIEALYASISGEKGEPRDWERFNALFVEDARLMPTGKNKEGKIGLRAMAPKEYIDVANDYLINNGFHEQEIYRVTESFGNILHLFSTYDSRNSIHDEKPFARGINSIQLLYDGERYWVVSIFWMSESAEDPIPSKYLPK